MADSSNNIEALKNKKKLRVFILFLVLSFLLWALIKLSKEYISDVNFKVSYSDLPSDKLLQNEVESNIRLTVKTEGFKLLKYKLVDKEINYPLKDVKKLNQNNYYSQPNNNLNFIQAQFEAETNILKAKPDTLYFEFGKKHSKVIEVTSMVKLEFNSGYDLTEKVVIEPNEISITGPIGILDSIDQILTEDIEIDGISKSFEKEINLLNPNKNITLSVDKILLKANVDKFTEGSFDLKVEVINVPKSYVLRTYPQEVKVVFKSALSDYNKVLPEGFRVVCDFKQTAEGDLKYLIPKIIEQPEMVTSAKIVPNKIEYLIKK